MCGISGLFCGDGRLRDDHYRLVGQMTHLMRHRGPNGSGLFGDTHAALGMRRLAIIDTAGGNQPLYNEREDIVVVANGEIYNHVELRSLLERRGHRLRTHSDIEVIAHLYEDHGESFAEHLNGMFAIALYDQRARKLILCRDRIGKKPLYYTERDGLYAFCSDIKPLLHPALSDRRIDEVALAQLFSHNYVRGARTIWQGVREVEPGSMMVLTPGDVRAAVYWRLEDVVDDDPRPLPEADAVEQLSALLSDSVRLRLRSDVPVGAFLSGGLDSSVVVGLAIRARGNRSMPTFSVGFVGAESHEEPQDAARTLGTLHAHGEISPARFASLLPAVMWYLEEPHGDSSFVPTYALSLVASQKVRVVLTGDGADEILGGYERYQRPTGGASEPILQSQEISELLGIPLAAARAAAEPLPGGNDVRRMMIHDTRTLLTDNNVVKPDKMAMAASVEARCPYLDYRLVEWALNVPVAMHVNEHHNKRLLRAMAHACGLYGANRPKRQFTVPVGDWIREQSSGYNELLEAVQRREYFSPNVVKRFVSEHAHGHNRTRQLRLFIAFEAWARVFIDQTIDSLFAGPPADTRHEVPVPVA